MAHWTPILLYCIAQVSFMALTCRQQQGFCQTCLPEEQSHVRLQLLNCPERCEQVIKPFTLWRAGAGGTHDAVLIQLCSLYASACALQTCSAFGASAKAMCTCREIWKDAPCCLETEFWKWSCAACRPDLLASLQSYWLQRSFALPKNNTTYLTRM